MEGSLCSCQTTAVLEKRGVLALTLGAIEASHGFAGRWYGAVVMLTEGPEDPSSGVGFATFPELLNQPF